ncbi:YegS/Rv2252/BmrU family lipid kinase [Heliobacterium gestii]|uniref:YegS/Rv2252/BmrU family lipid kinase n=1 Tax=Heliomicrobium gestii TaxID=2699 RepID=A0A845LC07_HELGE|nr:YegS/Rv2252/BmrU family lipid kinase [Heliomicrobium gestii]MBM7866749.1 YegS/Rv2252/BmrU family lipid kinase [Heliomicrobium gestii]MZP42179.1 YegS/Rv2252/BmrU family lipid kinase [Heliomicrobium gestii]
MPKRMKLIYNPEAGVGAFRRHLDRAIAIFQQGGWQVLAHRTREAPGDTADAAEAALAEGCSAVVAVGGDGTLHQVINGLMRLSAQAVTPPNLGIIPAGTANDLASFLRLPRDVEACCRIIVEGKTRPIDVGQLGPRFFLNVASGGLMTDVSHKVAQPLKHNIGKVAYYLKALEKLPEFRPFALTVETPEGALAYSGETLLFLIMNGAGAGSFTTLAPSAKLDDGLLDLLAFRACSISEFVGLFVRVLQGEHIRSPLVTYHQAPAFRISGSPDLETDLDGEVGPSLPWEIGVCHRGLTVFSPNL